MGDHDFKLNVDSLIERLLEGECRMHGCVQCACTAYTIPYTWKMRMCAANWLSNVHIKWWIILKCNLHLKHAARDGWRNTHRPADSRLMLIEPMCVCAHHHKCKRRRMWWRYFDFCFIMRLYLRVCTSVRVELPIENLAIQPHSKVFMIRFFFFSFSCVVNVWTLRQSMKC